MRRWATYSFVTVSVKLLCFTALENSVLNTRNRCVKSATPPGLMFLARSPERILLFDALEFLDLIDFVSLCLI